MSEERRAEAPRELPAASRNEELEVKRLAETTDLSPRQARELLRKHGGDLRKVEEIAKTYKAEG